MRKLFFFLLLLFPAFAVGQVFTHPENNDAFLQTEVAEVHITVSQSDLNTLLGDSLFSEHHFPGVFRYESSSFSDTIQNVGFRVRGNTSRNAKKKGFKVSFNEYTTGQKFKGIEKMNLDRAAQRPFTIAVLDQSLFSHKTRHYLLANELCETLYKRRLQRRVP